MLSMHLRQLFRKPLRTILYFMVLVILTAFFCTSLNLYMNSQYNLRLADETYTTIAIMELYTDVDSYGNLISNITKADDYAGYYALTVYGYDLEPIINAPSVKKYELRARYGAFSENNIAKKMDENIRGLIVPYYNEDVLHFKLNIDNNTMLDPYNAGQEITPNLTPNGFALPDLVLRGIYSDREKHWLISFVFDVIDTATDVFLTKDKNAGRINAGVDISGEYIFEHYTDALKKLNYTDPSQNYVYLEPDVEYIGVIRALHGNAGRGEFGTEMLGKNTITQMFFEADVFFTKPAYRYQKGRNANQEFVGKIYTEEHPFWLYKYEDVENDPELKEKYEQISRAYHINSRSFGVTTTNDITGIPAFNLGNMFIREGHAISDEEFASGAKVCMISKEQAVVQNWKVGQKINFNFYEYGFFTNATFWNSQLSPRYTYTSPDHFFDSGEYEVVGIYDVRPMTGSSTISEAAISVPWNTIYIPEKSLTNAPAEEDRPVTGALLTIWLENGKIEPFIERMNELGITGAKQGDYEARFTFYDQGYSRIQPSLEALSGTAELLLILSSSLLVIAALLLAFFYAQSQKQSIGTMRLLGCSKARAFAAVMLSALIIAVTAALIGAAIGHALTAGVGESIMASANQTPEEFLAFSAYLAESTQVEVEFALGADAKVSLLTCLAALGLFIAGTLVFVIRYLGKGPRELLPRAGE